MYSYTEVDFRMAKAVHKVLQTVIFREEGVDIGTKMVITDRREA